MSTRVPALRETPAGRSPAAPVSTRMPWAEHLNAPEHNSL